MNNVFGYLFLAFLVVVVVVTVVGVVRQDRRLSEQFKETDRLIAEFLKGTGAPIPEPELTEQDKKKIEKEAIKAKEKLMNIEKELRG